MRPGKLIGFLLAFFMLIQTSYSVVPDSDFDGVPDENDKCPNSSTYIVDQDGCSCSQKNCPSDNNECTNDCSVVDGLPNCFFTNNNNPCGAGRCYNGSCSDEIFYEHIKCVFINSTERQKCYSEKGYCSDIEGCIVFNVTGFKGENVTWKSTCGGYSYTIIDGSNKHAYFSCSNQPSIEVKEQVKCVFMNSTALHKCYSEGQRGYCSGTESCVADVKGNKGEEVIWKSSCGGYAYTLMDGINEYAYFECDYNQTNGTVFFNRLSNNQTNGTLPNNQTYPNNQTNNTFIQLKTCTEQGGYTCVGSQVCRANIIKASDTNRCCTDQCTPMSQTTCSKCGKGLFNLCDKEECLRVAELCYFAPSRKCNKCAGASCSSYPNKQICDENHCNFDNCIWSGNSCTTAIYNQTG